MSLSELADRLFPGVTETPAEIMARYPKRELPEGAAVTRIAPSPTGFMHIGNLYGALVDERLAQRSGGVFMLRIEDTDLKRSVNKGVEKIIQAFDRFGLEFDEGVTLDGEKEITALTGSAGVRKFTRCSRAHCLFRARLPVFCDRGRA